MFSFLKSRLLRNGVMMLSGLLPFAHASATCSMAPVGVYFPSTISVPRDAPVGTVLGTVTTTVKITCNSSGASTSLDGSWDVYLSPTNPDYGAASVASTRQTYKAGIGLQWSNLSSYTNTTSPVSNYAFDSPYTTWQRGIALSGVTTFTDTWTLVKTGPITAGDLQVPDLSLNTRTPVSNKDMGTMGNYSTTDVNLVVESCSVSTSSVKVSLGAIPSTSFTGVGSTSAKVPVPITLSCSSGTQVDVQVTATAVSGQSGTIPLTSGTGVASGVGVQMLDAKNNPLTLNAAFLVGTATSNGTFNINWQARYIQTASKVTAGVANATATFTMTYP